MDLPSRMAPASLKNIGVNDYFIDEQCFYSSSSIRFVFDVSSAADLCRGFGSVFTPIGERKWRRGRWQLRL